MWEAGAVGAAGGQQEGSRASGKEHSCHATRPPAVAGVQNHCRCACKHPRPTAHGNSLISLTLHSFPDPSCAICL